VAATARSLMVKYTWIRAVPYRKIISKELSYNTRFTRDQTVLPATTHEPNLPLLRSRRSSPPIGRYSLRLPMEGWPG